MSRWSRIDKTMGHFLEISTFGNLCSQRKQCSWAEMEAPCKRRSRRASCERNARGDGIGRRERIRTSGPYVPNVVLYQAELLSEPVPRGGPPRLGRRPYNDGPPPPQP